MIDRRIEVETASKSISLSSQVVYCPNNNQKPEIKTLQEIHAQYQGDKILVKVFVKITIYGNKPEKLESFNNQILEENKNNANFNLLPGKTFIQGVFPYLGINDLVAFSRVYKKTYEMNSNEEFGIPCRENKIQNDIMKPVKEMAENRLVIQQHIEKLPPDLTQDQKIKYIASVLFNGLKTQKTTEQLILLMLHHKSSSFNPFRGEKGSRTSKGFGYHAYPIGIGINHEIGKPYFALVIFNWHYEVPNFFQQLFVLDGNPCYLVTDLPTSDVFVSKSTMSQIGKRFYNDKNSPIRSQKIRTLWKILTRSNGLIKDFLVFRQNENYSSRALNKAILFLHETYHCYGVVCVNFYKISYGMIKLLKS